MAGWVATNGPTALSLPTDGGDAGGGWAV